MNLNFNSIISFVFKRNANGSRNQHDITNKNDNNQINHNRKQQLRSRVINRRGLYRKDGPGLLREGNNNLEYWK